MSARQPKPCAAGDTVTLRDPHHGGVVTGVVEEVRWDSWLYGGEYRIFARVEGSEHLQLYFSARDLIAGGSLPTALFDLSDFR